MEIISGTKKYIGNNNKWILVTDRSLSEVGTPPPHDSDKTHGLVARKKNNNIYHISTLKNKYFYFIPQKYVEAPVPSRGVSGWVFKSDQPPC